ncbi:Phosphoesterase domain [Macleaya cordata]|uniref:Purple acid phosphatase n=1 Tax=Macleaya cordata TaxID=56857 RepID=A0A200PZD2_MACCD|nr:Phosphoesterase domain [Macleaya cordata]
MKNWYSSYHQVLAFLSIFFFILHLTQLQHFQAAGAAEYVRPPPRRIISTTHNRPKSHPQQVHISLVGSDHMRISWITNDKSVPSMVEYGKVPGKYNASATGEHTSYRYFFYSSGKIHHVKIGPLDPNTIYYYRCGGVGDEFTFKTTPSKFPIQFALAGDLGQTEWTASTLAHVNKTDYDVLLLPGDLSYADSQQPLWDTFGRFVEKYASRRPWMVTQGNHEVEAFPILKINAFKAYNSRWIMPYQESGSHSNLYYSFDVAGVHIVMLGSYTDFDGDSAQYKWLQADLAKVNRKKTPWLVTIIHVPWYNTNIAHQGEGESMRKAMEDLLYKAKLDIVFAGHVHAYERFTRVYDNEANPCGPMHLTVGDGGNREGLALMFKKPTSPLSLFQEASFGHGRLRVLNRTHAHWTWHRNDDEHNSSISDEVWLKNLSVSEACKEAAEEDQEPSNAVNDEL